MLAYAVVDDALSPNFPLGVDALEVFILREDAERFIEGGARRRPRTREQDLRIEERALGRAARTDAGKAA